MHLVRRMCSPLKVDGKYFFVVGILLNALLTLFLKHIVVSILHCNFVTLNKIVVCFLFFSSVIFPLGFFIYFSFPLWILVSIFCYRVTSHRFWCPVLCSALDPQAWKWSLHWTTCNTISFWEDLCTSWKFAFLRSIWWFFSQHAWMHVQTVSILQKHVLLWWSACSFQLCNPTGRSNLLVQFCNDTISVYVIHFFFWWKEC